MAQWLSWLERRPVTAKVVGSSPIWVVIWDLSSAGRASALQAEGHRFEPCRSHLFADVAHFVKINERSELIAGRAADYKSAADIVYYADVAQLAEQLICNQQVIGSSPIIGFLLFYNFILY